MRNIGRFFAALFMALALCGLVCASAGASSYICAADYQGHTYKIYAGSPTWAEARREAEALGGHLATLESSGELSAVRKLSAKFGKTCWLGARYNGAWKWVDGKKVERFSWAAGHAQASAQTPCLAMYGAGSQKGKWDALAVDAPVGGFVVEFDEISTTTKDVSGVRLGQSRLSVGAGETALLRAEVVPAAATNQNLTWSSSRPSVASVDEFGRVTGLKKGSSVITATAHSGKSAACTVTVSERPVPAVSIALNKAALNLYVGDTKALTVAAAPKAATGLAVEWSSSDPQIAAVSVSGKVTARQSGDCVITAHLRDGVSASCRVTVRDVCSKSMKISGKALRVGQSAQFGAALKPGNTTDKRVAWESSDPQVAVVDASGRVTALKKGKATIRARALDGGASAAYRLTVAAVPVKKISFLGSLSGLMVGQTQQLTAKISPANATDPRVEWKSSDESVATVDQNGLVTARGVGKAKIKCAALDGGKAQAVVSFTVQEYYNPKRRALVIAEMTDTWGDYLPYNDRDVKGIAAMLRGCDFDGHKIKTETMINASLSQIRKKVDAIAAKADPRDVTYIYIICHGSDPRRTGEMLLGLSPKATVTARQLRALLDRIPGTVVLMLGSCHSGDVIGKGAEDFGQAFLRQFLAEGATAKSGEFKNGKYKVLCASAGKQSAYTGGALKCSWFAYALGSGAGYNPSSVQACKWLADENNDRLVTLAEMQAYAASVVKQLALDEGVQQSVVAYPSNSDFVLFRH